MTDPANSNSPIANETITVNATANADTDSVSTHPMLAVLKTKKRDLKKLSDRITLVEDLITDEIKSFLIDTICMVGDLWSIEKSE